MKSFAGKIFVVTGAGSGIGRALARKLATDGARLALADINEANLNETIREVSSKSPKVKGYKLDVSDRAAVYAFADQVAADFGGVDVVINNAGVALSETVEDMSYDDFEWLMNINFWGVVYGTKAFLPHLRKSGEAYIVNISSIFGLISLPTQAAYNAAKFAVRGFTEALRLELKGSTVTPICVHPGGIKTNIARNARFYKGMDGSDTHEDASAHFEKLAHTSPEGAANTILKGIKSNNRRVLIGPDAKVVDVMQRLLPNAYDKLLDVFLKQKLF
ncbi:MAG: SDR family oxidoreductase [Hahellaceae bacterium]|nr:SDR family oxidoreductase [Hahellaceae bacterium]